MPCLTVRTSQHTLHLAVDSHSTVRDALDVTELRVRAACGGTGACGACLIKWLSGEITSYTLPEYQKLSPAQRSDGIRLACQVRLVGDAEFLLEQPAHASQWKGIPTENLSSFDLPNPTLDTKIYGVSVDIGTTHLRVTLWDRKHSRRIASRCGYNPQGNFGADILNRLQASLTDELHARQLSQLLRESIIDAIRDILVRDVGELTPMLAEIGRVVIVGNTAMLALLTERNVALLLNPDYWQVPLDFSPEANQHWQSLWKLSNAEFIIPRSIGGFVGSDLTADLIALQLTKSKKPALLLDFGTNTEICFWDGDRLHITSVPGGPAFEGVGIRHGMSAETGAIYRINQHEDKLVIDVMGGCEAKGFCGSGLIDAVAILLKRGLLKPSGRFLIATSAEGVQMDADNPLTAITAGDIDALQRAKAAIAAAIICLVQQAYCTWAAIERLCICGAFGKHLNIDHAQLIGLLPPIPAKHIELHADAALSGCELAMLTGPSELFAQIGPIAEIINFSSSDSYDSVYIDQLRLRSIL